MAPDALDIRVDLAADPWTDLTDAPVLPATITRVGVLPHGTVADGRAVVVIAELDDGSGLVYAQVLYPLAAAAAVTFGRAYP